MTTWNILEGERPTWDHYGVSWDEVEATAWQVQASGASTSSGASAPEIVRVASAGGASTSSGGANGLRLMAVSGAGATVSAGGSAGLILRQAVAAGVMASVGGALGSIPTIFAFAGGNIPLVGGAGPIIPLLQARAIGQSATLGGVTGVRTKQGTVRPDSVAGQFNFFGADYTRVRDDPDAPDDQWITREQDVSSGIRFTFEDLQLNEGEELAQIIDGQEFRILVRAR